MFDLFRHPNGAFSLVAAGIALIALAALAGWLPFPGVRFLALALLFGGAACFVLAWKRHRDSRYDLSRLWEAPPPEPEEPYRDTVDEEAAPYCGWCDEPHAAGTYRCTRCGRELS
ncbi:MAG: hypothetical protein ACK47B_26890 [Armatimonadota bacterium]